jgi:hypothetical protein
MNYREAYLSIPFLISICSAGNSVNPATFWTPVTTDSSSCIGLKNWFGQIIHSFTMDYNGTTVIQQTPYVNMWNSFKLMTSMSFNDIITQGSVIGFYPDSSTSWSFNACQQSYRYDGTTLSSGLSPAGIGVCNNGTFGAGIGAGSTQNSSLASSSAGLSNPGHIKRMYNINFDLDAILAETLDIDSAQAYGQFINGSSKSGGIWTTTTMNQIWKSYISAKRNETATIAGLLQYSIVATVYLKHIHSFFNMVPLLKGVFMKLTMNLNNTSSKLLLTSVYSSAVSTPTALTCSSVSNPLGGVNPLLFSSGSSNALTEATVTSTNSSGSYNLFPIANATNTSITKTILINLSVGATCLDNSINTLTGITYQGTLSKSIYLYVPAYTFNSPFEQAYLSQSVKTIKYTDVYQYQVLSVANGQQFSNLLTNGIANVKSVLVLPFFSASAFTGTINAAGTATINLNTSFTQGVPVWQSPFDTAGTGTTSPLCFLTNFNVQVSGQNAIYNTERYAFEQFNNQLYGQNAVNGGLTDGLTSGLIGRNDFDLNYCYYYVNIERMLPVEETVPKSIHLVGNNLSSRYIDLICFVEYGCEIRIDPLTGARV